MTLRSVTRHRNEREIPMRLTLATPALIALPALAACSGGGGPDNTNAFHPNCDEQSELAKLGRTDGTEITITCPQG